MILKYSEFVVGLLALALCASNSNSPLLSTVLYVELLLMLKKEGDGSKIPLGTCYVM